MKKTMFKKILLFVGVFAPQVILAQGTTYLSNLGQSSTTSDPAGSDSWLAANFHTGLNTSGYLLNSVQLGLTDASGNPSSFTVMLYAQSSNPSASLPGSSLDTLNGSLNPITGGIYTYTPDISLTLSANTHYFIVVTAGMAIANGAYEWSVEDASPPFSLGWSQVNDFFQSSNGSSWIGITGSLEYAVNATAIPEPSASWLLLLGGGVLIYVRTRKRHFA
jgi:hypothetical protein